MIVRRIVFLLRFKSGSMRFKTLVEKKQNYSTNLITLSLIPMMNNCKANNESTKANAVATFPSSNPTFP
jgi:hypothetical protein